MQPVSDSSWLRKNDGKKIQNFVRCDRCLVLATEYIVSKFSMLMYLKILNKGTCHPVDNHRK